MINGTAENAPKKLIRNYGAAYRADRVPPPYTAVEHPVAGRFMTTIEAHMAADRYHDFLMWVNYPESVEAFDRITEFLQ